MSNNNIVLREKHWHNKRFEGGGDLRQRNLLLKYAYFSTSFAKQRFKSLQSVNNSRVLDVGCGRGISRAKMFVNKECDYLGVDISDECISANKYDADLAGINVDYVCDDANTLASLRDRQFDLIVMSGTLHHLDIKTSLDTFARLLAKDGKLLMWEPMATNPFINLYRNFTPNLRTVDEHPLTFQDLTYIKNVFPGSELELHVFTSLLSIPAHLVADMFRFPSLGRVVSDCLGQVDVILGRVPFLRRFHWIVIINSTF